MRGTMGWPAAVVAGLLLAVLAPVAPAATPAATAGAAFPLLADSPLGGAGLGDLAAGIILQATGLTVTEKELAAEIAKSAAQMRDELRQNSLYLVEQKASRSLLLREAKAWAAKHAPDAQGESATIQAYLKSVAATATVSEAEVRSFYSSNKSLVGGLPLDQVKADIRSYLVGQKRQTMVEQHINSLVTRAKPVLDRAWAEQQYRAAIANPVDKARLSGKPTLVDFGASGCGPCDMMAPILESLRREYAGKANVVFVQVRERQVLASRYGISTIPVQVFFDRRGKEVYRHVGFFPEAELKAKLREAGAK